MDENHETKAPGLGARIKALRILRGWDIEQLARRLDYSRQAVEHWEAGRRTPPLKTLQKIAEVLGVEVEVKLVPAAAELDDHAVEILMRLAEVLRSVPVERRKVLVAQVEELEERYSEVRPAPQGK